MTHSYLGFFCCYLLVWYCIMQYTSYILYYFFNPSQMFIYVMYNMSQYVNKWTVCCSYINRITISYYQILSSSELAESPLTSASYFSSSAVSDDADADAWPSPSPSRRGRLLVCSASGSGMTARLWPWDDGSLVVVVHATARLVVDEQLLQSRMLRRPSEWRGPRHDLHEQPCVGLSHHLS